MYFFCEPKRIENVGYKRQKFNIFQWMFLGPFIFRDTQYIIIACTPQSFSGAYRKVGNLLGMSFIGLGVMMRSCPYKAPANTPRPSHIVREWSWYPITSERHHRSRFHETILRWSRIPSNLCLSWEPQKRWYEYFLNVPSINHQTLQVYILFVYEPCIQLWKIM